MQCWNQAGFYSPGPVLHIEPGPEPRTGLTSGFYARARLKRNFGAVTKVLTNHRLNNRNFWSYWWKIYYINKSSKIVTKTSPAFSPTHKSEVWYRLSCALPEILALRCSFKGGNSATAWGNYHSSIENAKLFILFYWNEWHRVSFYPPPFAQCQWKPSTAFDANANQSM